MLMQQQIGGFRFGSDDYTKPVMIRTGSVGTITDNATGYLLTGFDANTYAYLDKPMSAGKWYWEAVVANFNLSGLAESPATPRTYGGYSSANAGVYSTIGAWGGAGYSASGAWAASVGDTIGFAYNADTDTLYVYANNVLKSTITTPASALYAMFAFQSAPSQQVRLGASCTYTPPSGYSYL